MVVSYDYEKEKMYISKQPPVNINSFYLPAQIKEAT
jgi:hypothetical protein